MKRFKTKKTMAGAFVAFAALIVVVLLVRWLFFSVRELAVSEALYTYAAGVKSSYSDGITLQYKDGTMYVNTEDRTQSMPNVIFYYEEEDAILLQETMLWDDLRGGSQQRLDFFNKAILQSGVVLLQTEKESTQTSGGILYNGSNAYILLEEATLCWENEELTLSPLSTVVASYGGFLEVYDYETKEAFAEELNDSDAALTFANGAQVYVATDRVSLINGSWYLLPSDVSSISSLE